MSLIPITQLSPNTGQIPDVPKNPRFIRDERYKALCRSIAELPEMLELRELLVFPFEGKYVVIAGNMRLKAMKDAGYKEAPCKVLPADMPPEKLREIAIKDNVPFGNDDHDALANEWDMTELEAWGMELPVWDTAEETAVEDEYIPTPEIQTDIVVGDLIEIGEHRLLCGDSTDSDAVAKLMSGALADLWITDAPYGVSYADKNKYLNAISRGNRIQTEIKNDHNNIAEMKVLWCDVAKNVLLFSSKKCSYYWFMCQGGEQMMMMMALDEAGWKVRHELVWVKNNHVLGRTDYAYKHEPIAYGWRNDGTHEFYGGFQTSVFEVDKPLSNDLHPTMKPIELLSQFITNSSTPKQIVLDTFLGSGSTMVAAHQLNRKCYGMELEPRYCQVIIDRMKKLAPGITIRRNGIELTNASE